MSVAPGGGASGGGSSANKVGALLLGGGLIAIIAIFGPRLLDDDDDPVEPAPASVPSGGGGGSGAQPTASQPAVRPQPTTRPTQTADEELRADPDNVILTVTVYGMPGRVGAETIDRGIEIRQRQKGSCSPDDQYPEPCVTYYVAKRGTEMRIYGGDSQAGYWPVLSSVSGAGCNVSGPLRADFSCPVTLLSDMGVEARYYGDTTNGGTVYYPKCPASLGNTRPTWASRCQ